MKNIPEKYQKTKTICISFYVSNKEYKDIQAAVKKGNFKSKAAFLRYVLDKNFKKWA